MVACTPHRLLNIPEAVVAKYHRVGLGARPIICDVVALNVAVAWCVLVTDPGIVVGIRDVSFLVCGIVSDGQVSKVDTRVGGASSVSTGDVTVTSHDGWILV